MARIRNPLTVSELIEELRLYDPDDLVLVDGYEGGYCAVDCQRIERRTDVFLDQGVIDSESWFYGEYSDLEYDGNSGIQSSDTLSCVIIHRTDL